MRGEKEQEDFGGGPLGDVEHEDGVEGARQGNHLMDKACQGRKKRKLFFSRAGGREGVEEGRRDDELTLAVLRSLDNPGQVHNLDPRPPVMQRARNCRQSGKLIRGRLGKCPR